MTAAKLSSFVPHLTNGSNGALFGHVKTLAKKIMVAVLFAVAMLGGSELPILHAPQFAEAHAFVHQHMNDALSGAHHHDIASQDAGAQHGHEDADRQPGSDHGCTHVHAHCCAATAILMSLATAPLVDNVGQLRIERNGALPYGQLSHPPLRPPRLTA